MTERYHLCWVHRPGGDLVFHVREAVTLGRGPDNEIVVDEDGVSRRHCRLEVRSDGLHLEDLGSTNGTFVNGARVHEARLTSGDTVLVGRALFEVRGGAEARPNVTRLVGAETIQVALRAAEADDPARWAPRERAAEHLRTLCEVIEIINGAGGGVALGDGDARGIDALYRRTLEVLAGQLGATYAAVLLDLDPAAAPFAVFPADSVAAPSRTVVARALGGEAVLANDPHGDESLSGAVSLAGQEGTGILCGPVTLRGEVLGALYLTSRPGAAPWREADLRLVSIVGRAIGLAAANLHRQAVQEAENASLRAELAGDQDIIGESPAIAKVVEIARRAAATDATVLLTGETGTGKELFARAIHAWSRRSGGPFVAVNCGAIPASMVESELFGHEKGAFTGAAERRIGRFEMAQGGTLFLDEIGELPLEMQVKLLRVLEDRRFYRVGGSREISPDVRILSATNRDLAARVKEGQFREDLLYRVRVLELPIPALRERGEDVLAIAEHLLARLAAQAGRRPPTLDAGARRRLREYGWPGNVRELRNVLERALILTPSDTMGADDVLPGSAVASAAADAGDVLGELVPLTRVEREHIRAVLDATGWNKSRAAEILGIGRTNIYEKIKQYDLKPDDE